MPTHFGPATGPRSDPEGRRYDWSGMEATSLSLTLEGDADAIDRVLPPGFARLGAPQVIVAYSSFSNLPWLAGRGYEILGVRTPTTYGDHVGELSFVLWENFADPIITGREELGVNKIYCELSPLKRYANRARCDASWLGYQFCTLEAHELSVAEVPASLGPTKGQLLHHKYFPKTQEWGEADVDQVTLTPPPQGGEILSCEAGTGSITWGEPRWEDMPTQYQIVNGLREIASGSVLSCTLMKTRGFVADHHDQQVVG